MINLKYTKFLIILLLLNISCDFHFNEEKTQSSLEQPLDTVNPDKILKNLEPILCKKCDIKIIVKTVDSIFVLNSDKISEFLCTYEKDCQNNIEFVEFYNETLFLVIERYPELTIKILNSFKEKSASAIIDNLKSPINDAVDINSLYSKIQNLSIEDEKILFNVLSALDIAKSKY